LTACPSQSTADMLRSRGVPNVRIWPRGVDLEIFGPHRRSHTRRRSWRIETAPQGSGDACDAKMALPKGIVAPLTPPPSPDLLPADEQQRRSESAVVLYVGRMYVAFSFHVIFLDSTSKVVLFDSSYEKNIMLLIQAFEQVAKNLPPKSLAPRLVLVGDGPARAHLEAVCKKEGIDAVFEGHLSGIELAEAYASADVFA
jgi:glycosyltransferase involved in cell wall biosynthesis